MRVEHVGEHVDVAELGHLVADGEEPAARALRLLGHVAAAGARREDLEAGAEEVVRPDRALRAGDLVAQVHAAAERPAHLELAHRAALEADQRDRVVLGLDRVHERVRPAHHLDRAGCSLPMYERMISMQWQPRSTIGPPPACAASQNHALCGPGCVSRERAHVHVADRARLHGRDRLQRLRRVDEVLEVAAEHAGALDVSSIRFASVGRAGERLRAEHRLAVRRAELDGLLVQVVRQPDHDRVRRRGARLRARGRSSIPARRCRAQNACARSSERE